MRDPAALQAALQLVARPAAVRHARESRLPENVLLVLEIAAGKADTLRYAQSITGLPHDTLRAAAGFFIEQVLFGRHADSYRILGASADAPRTRLRQHMILLMQWLHPDRQEQRASGSDIDRTVFIHRVTQAWEDLKSYERRVIYDQALRKKAQAAVPESAPSVPGSDAVGRPKRMTNISDGADKKRRFSRLVMYRFKSATLLSRLFIYLHERQ
jgi:hypothetical protein